MQRLCSARLLLLYYFLYVLIDVSGLARRVSVTVLKETRVHHLAHLIQKMNFRIETHIQKLDFGASELQVRI